EASSVKGHPEKDHSLRVQGSQAETLSNAQLLSHSKNIIEL
ncbi:7970_t:CDS:1, partial [Funneliformis mosseae]